MVVAGGSDERAGPLGRDENGWAGFAIAVTWCLIGLAVAAAVVDAAYAVWALVSVVGWKVTTHVLRRG